jgi:hypothetical protein
VVPELAAAGAEIAQPPVDCPARLELKRSPLPVRDLPQLIDERAHGHLVDICLVADELGHHAEAQQPVGPLQQWVAFAAAMVVRIRQQRLIVLMLVWMVI